MSHIGKLKAGSSIVADDKRRLTESGWHTIYSVDFRTLPAQDLTAGGDGTKDFGDGLGSGFWSVVNTGAANSMAITANGLEIDPNSGTDFDGTTQTAPYVMLFLNPPINVGVFKRHQEGEDMMFIYDIDFVPTAAGPFLAMGTKAAFYGGYRTRLLKKYHYDPSNSKIDVYGTSTAGLSYSAGDYQSIYEADKRLHLIVQGSEEYSSIRTARGWFYASGAGWSAGMGAPVGQVTLIEGSAAAAGSGFHTTWSYPVFTCAWPSGPTPCLGVIKTFDVLVRPANGLIV